MDDHVSGSLLLVGFFLLVRHIRNRLLAHDHDIEHIEYRVKRLEEDLRWHCANCQTVMKKETCDQLDTM